ncbi:monovalent cation/H(+) antiporter subunit G [Paracoccus liaowanqingii]|uniref:Monovalent cation/H(+) antiporter subunit G n=1 Tax=Paracoccus liaowanqingii TaxID=2560053 RepID=A0A4P7HKV5_9RHOB|nr:monovalent cation/H(+) antiporter subunit G [Paracoccus liaowanqingii]QBX34828.1 monovalent cation/H(+) antiporter subunit G [Paracoccus liaowanqingii]
MITELIVSLFVVAGGIFCFAAGMGVLRLPDLMLRMHASTKAGTLGSGLILVAVAIAFAESTVVARAVAAILFLILTAPVAAHLIGRAAFRTGVPMVDDTACEEGVAEALRKRPPEAHLEAAAAPAVEAEPEAEGGTLATGGAPRKAP